MKRGRLIFDLPADSLATVGGPVHQDRLPRCVPKPWIHGPSTELRALQTPSDDPRERRSIPPFTDEKAVASLIKIKQLLIRENGIELKFV